MWVEDKNCVIFFIKTILSVPCTTMSAKGMSAMWKKMLAPILITVLLVAWFAVWLIGCALLPIPWFWKGIGILVSAAWIGVSVYVLVQRIKEIRSGEENDLSKY